MQLIEKLESTLSLRCFKFDKVNFNFLLNSLELWLPGKSIVQGSLLSLKYLHREISFILKPKLPFSCSHMQVIHSDSQLISASICHGILFECFPKLIGSTCQSLLVFLQILDKKMQQQHKQSSFIHCIQAPTILSISCSFLPFSSRPSRFTMLLQNPYALK